MSLLDFKQFYDEHSDALYRSVYFRVSSTDRASDVAQEAFIRLWRNWDTYDSDTHRTRSLYTIARNLVTDYFRTKHRTIPIGDHEVIDTSESAGDTIDRSIDQARLARALAHLSDSDREVIISHSIDRRPYRELSQLLQKPEATIRKIHNRALTKLTKIFHTLYGINYKPY